MKEVEKALNKLGIVIKTDVEGVNKSFSTVLEELSKKKSKIIGKFVETEPKCKENVETLKKDIDASIKKFVDDCPTYAKDTDINIGISTKVNPASTLLKDTNKNINEFVAKSKTGFVDTYEGTPIYDNVLDVKTASEEELKEMSKTGHIGVYEPILLDPKDYDGNLDETFTCKLK